MQLTLPNFSIKPVKTILGAPILRDTVQWFRGKPYLVEVVGGRFQGEEYVYILWLDRKIARVQGYCGSTDDPGRRFKEHERKWPLYRLTFHDICDLQDEYGLDLSVLLKKTYRRKHTFLKAIQQVIGDVDAAEHQFTIFNIAKKHTSNGIIMAANQRGIGWRVARLFQADRSLEFAIKRQRKSLSRFLLDDDLPF